MTTILDVLFLKASFVLWSNISSYFRSKSNKWLISDENGDTLQCWIHKWFEGFNNDNDMNQRGNDRILNLWHEVQ